MSKILGFEFKWSKVRKKIKNYFQTGEYKDYFDNLTHITNKKDVQSGRLIVGKQTYGEISIIDANLSKIIIGNYCSIAENTLFILGYHRTDLITTYPFKFLNEYYPNAQVVEEDHISKGDIIVGNDVWIGAGVTIMSGVKIGDGAVIGSGSIVTKDVEPYSIVVGNPAKFLKYRVEDPMQRQQLQEIAWWNWSEEKVCRNINKIMSNDISAFIAEFYGVEKY